MKSYIIKIITIPITFPCQHSTNKIIHTSRYLRVCDRGDIWGGVLTEDVLGRVVVLGCCGPCTTYRTCSCNNNHFKNAIAF